MVRLAGVRAVLIVNPNATSTTPAGRDLLAHALESRVELDVVHTDHRGHAIEIGRDATRDGIDVVIVHGGDGTVNEVVNGILGECGSGLPRSTGHRPSAWCPVVRRTSSPARSGSAPIRSRPPTSSSTCSAPTATAPRGGASA